MNSNSHSAAMAGRTMEHHFSTVHKALLYLGMCESRIHSGQSFGKNCFVTEKMALNRNIDRLAVTCPSKDKPVIGKVVVVEMTRNNS